jgi:hypothetical protein
MSTRDFSDDPTPHEVSRVLFNTTLVLLGATKKGVASTGRANHVVSARRATSWLLTHICGMSRSGVSEWLYGVGDYQSSVGYHLRDYPNDIAAVGTVAGVLRRVRENRPDVWLWIRHNDALGKVKWGLAA